MVRQALTEVYIADPTDNLILCCVLRHAGLNPDPDGRKAFLSGNHRDFGQPDVKTMLNAVGVKYFSKTGDALGWLRAEPKLTDPGPTPGGG